MSGRIWPGALCVVVPPADRSQRLAGRIVTAGVAGRCDLGSYAVSGDPPSIMCRFERPWFDDEVGVMVRQCLLFVHWLRPILPPPSADTTEDRSPCEVESV